MRDEDFECFIADFGEATYRRQVPDSALTAWRGRLPDQLLTYWQQEGWCGYKDGLIWTVDPTDYADVVSEWLAETPLATVDRFHVFARSAFGKLYVIGERSKSDMTINCPFHGVIAFKDDIEPGSTNERDGSIRAFFASSQPDQFDIDDARGQPLFARALSKLGPLAEDEVYGFEPAMIAGGTNDLAHLRRVKADQHLTILRQLASPSIPFAGIEAKKLLSK